MMSDTRRQYHLGLLLVTGSAVVWSTAGLFTRMIAADTPTMLFWRGVFGALGIGLFMLIRDGRTAFSGLTPMSWIYAVISAAGMLFFISSLRHTSVAHAAIIYAAVPFIAGAASWLVLREAMGRSAILASLAALVGVGIMAGLSSDGSAFGDGLALMMTLCVAGMMIVSRMAKGTPMLAAAALSALLSALAVLPFADVLTVTASELPLLAAFGLVNSALGLALFTLGAQRLPPAETGLIGALDAPLAPVLVWLFFSETPGTATLVGGAIVFVAVLLHTLASARRA